MVKIRTDKKANYRAIFLNGKTIRQRIDNSLTITSPTFAEIEDVAINSKCYANCHYCYTKAVSSGTNFDNIVEKANLVWGGRELNDRPFQIAIGGAGESTLHPDWVEFVQFINELGIMPNYTTNGMHLSENILYATEKCCGGVAISYHPHIKKIFHRSIERFSGIKVKLNCHLIIGDKNSLIEAQNLFELYHDKLDYFVLLPYQAVGRGVTIEVESTWFNMFDWISSLDNKNKIALGALFYPFLVKNNIHDKLKIDIYEPEIYSGYRIFDESFMTLRKSSYNLEPKGEL